MNKFLLNTIWQDPTMYITLGLLVALGLMIWFSSRRRRAMQSQITQMHEELRPGQRVRTVGGVVGRIKEIREESPGFRTVLLQTGNDKFPAYMLFDIQAIYGIVPEEGHTIDGKPLGAVQATNPATSDPSTHVTKINGEEIDAREYVEKRNSLSKSKSGSKKR